MIIEIDVKQTWTKENKIAKSKVIIIDGKSLTKFYDRDQGMRVYVMMKQLKRPVIYTNGIITELHGTMLAEEIADKIEKENKLIFDELNKTKADGTMRLEQIRTERKEVL